VANFAGANCQRSAQECALCQTTDRGGSKGNVVERERGGGQMKLQAMHKMQMKCAIATHSERDAGTIVNV